MSKSQCEVVSQPLDSPEFISILSSFRNLLLSAVGPKGGLKMLVTSGGYSIVTSSSTRILGYLPVNNPICLYISQIIKSQLAGYKDSGLFTGILTSSLLIHSLSQQIAPLNTVTSLVEKISSELDNNLNLIKIKVDFSLVRQLLPLVKSILTSKPSCLFSNISADVLAIQIVKAFLNSVDEVVGDVNVVSNSSFDNSVHPGILYQTGLFTISNEILYLFKNINNKHRKSLVLFNIMLSDDKASELKDTERVSLDPDNKELYNVEKTLQIMKYAVNQGVKIVACQKVVHPLLCLYLRRNGVLLLDRMGTELTRCVEKLSGAVPISDIDKVTCEEYLIPLLGHVDTVHYVQFGEKSYISLERDDKNVTTLLIGGINVEATEELKVTVDQCLQSLRHLLVEPYILPGAGCLETSLLASLEASVMKRNVELTSLFSASHIEATLRWFQLSLLSAAGFSNAALTSLYVDTSYYHAWDHAHDQAWAVCRCGLINANMILSEEKTWVNLDLNSKKLLTGCKMPNNVSISIVHEKAIVDLYASKYNAFKLSLESFVSLMGIGMIVYKPAK